METRSSSHIPTISRAIILLSGLALLRTAFDTSWKQHGTADSVLLHLVNQRCPLHPQAFRSTAPATDHPVAGMKRKNDMIALYFLEN
jgi:hypothetical protein